MSAVEVATDINPDSLMTYTAYIRRPFILPQPRAPSLMPRALLVNLYHFHEHVAIVLFEFEEVRVT